MVLDFHTHTFPDAISGRIIDSLARSGHIRHYTNASRPELIASMQASGIDWSVNQPVHTRPDQVEKINRDLIEVHDEMLGFHLLTFGGMHPDYEPVHDELLFLKEHGIPGIKLHPAFQRTDLNAPGMKRVIAAASELDMMILIHGGLDVSYPDHNYASVQMILEIIEEIHPPKLIVAHMGGWGCWDEVRHYLAGAPIWLDTAFSIGPVEPYENSSFHPIRNHNLTDEAFVSLARMHGTDRILFGTDSPWSDQKAYLDKFHAMPFSPQERNDILGLNAARLLNMK